MIWNLPLGAQPVPDGVRFRVWAPVAERVDVVLYGAADGAGGECAHPLAPGPGGYFAGAVPGAGPGVRYRYQLDGGQAYPDPASRSQPNGVHGTSLDALACAPLVRTRNRRR